MMSAKIFYTKGPPPPKKKNEPTRRFKEILGCMTEFTIAMIMIVILNDKSWFSEFVVK